MWIWGKPIKQQQQEIEGYGKKCEPYEQSVKCVRGKEERGQKVSERK